MSERMKKDMTTGMTVRISPMMTMSSMVSRMTVRMKGMTVRISPMMKMSFFLFQLFIGFHINKKTYNIIQYYTITV